METVKGSGEDLASLNKEELKLLFQKINAMLSKGLLSGAHLEDQEENIRTLNEISEELNRRKAFPVTVRS